MTNAEIMDRTPAPEHMIQLIKVRQKDTLAWSYMGKDQVSKHFAVSKYTIGNNVCYEAVPNNRSELDAETIGASPYGTGIVYHLVMNETSVANVSYFRLILH